MEKKITINNTDLTHLIREVAGLEPGATKMLVASISKTNEAEFTFTSTDETIKGNINKALTRGYKLTKDFFHQVKSKIKKSLNELARPEIDLDYYVDEKGRPYTINEFNTREYEDPRGFNYYISHDLDGKEVPWVKMDDKTRGTFLDEDRTKLLVGNKLYMVDENMQLDYDHAMDYIGPRR